MRIALTIVIIIIALAWLNRSGEEDGADNNLVKGLSQIRQLFDDSPLNILKNTETTTVYKRLNADGEPEFTDQPSADGESTVYRPDINIIPALPQQDKPPAPKKPEQTDTKLSPLTPYTNPGKVLDLINDAKNIENTLEERRKKMDQQLKDMQ